MKLVKLNRRYRLFRDGFTHAFVGSSSEKQSTAIHNYLNRTYGHHNYNRRGAWVTEFGTGRIEVPLPGRHNLTYRTKPYYIAVRNEADVTACLLFAGA